MEFSDFEVLNSVARISIESGNFLHVIFKRLLLPYTDMIQMARNWSGHDG